MSVVHRPENQPHPGMHQKQSLQKAKGGDSPPCRGSHETWGAHAHPALGPSAQQRCGAVRTVKGRTTNMIAEMKHLSCKG